MMQVASVPLGLVSMQAPLISRSTCSAKLPCILSENHGSRRDCRIHVYLRLQGMEGVGVCTRRTEYSSKHPLPTFVEK